MITVMNLKNNLMSDNPTHIRVDRKNVLGNPFPMLNKTRDKVCDEHKEWIETILDGELPPNTSNYLAKKVILELKRLKQLSLKHKDIYLYCWCAPKRCHADEYKRILESDKYNFLLGVRW